MKPLHCKKKYESNFHIDSGFFCIFTSIVQQRPTFPQTIKIIKTTMASNTNTVPSFPDDDSFNQKLHSPYAISNSVNTSIDSASTIPLPGTNLIQAHSTPTQQQQTDQNKKKRNWNKRNFTLDGHLNVMNRCTGQDLSDTHYRCRVTLLKNSKNFHNLTGGPIELTITPLTDKGTLRHYRSPNFDRFRPKLLTKTNKTSVASTIHNCIQHSQQHYTPCREDTNETVRNHLHFRYFCLISFYIVTVSPRSKN